MIHESTTPSIIERHTAHLLTWLSLSLQSLNGSPIITPHTHKACEDPLKLRREHGMTYLSKSRHVFTFWTFGCFDSTSGFINTLVIYWCFMGDMCILSDCLIVMLSKYDGKIIVLFLDVNSIEINVEWWKYNQNDCYNNIIINSTHSIGGFYHTIPIARSYGRIQHVITTDLDLVQFYSIVIYALWWLTFILSEQVMNTMECLIFKKLLWFSLREHMGKHCFGKRR